MASTLANKIDILEKSIQTVLLDSLANPQEENAYSKIATVITSSTKSTVIPVGLPIRQMSEQAAESQSMSGLDLSSIEVTAKRFSTGFIINYDDFTDHGTDAIVDLYSPRMQELSLVAQKFYDKLIMDYLVSNPDTFTGESLFSNSQTWGGRTSTSQDNLLGLALSEANLKTAIGTIKGFKDQYGQPMVQTQKLNLVVPVALEYTAKQLVNATINSYGATNVLQGVANVVVSEYLSDANDWYLTAGKTNLMVVERMAPEVKMIVNEEKETVFCRVKMRAAPAVGSWTAFVKSVE